MNCAYSKEILALYVENDLPTLDSKSKVEAHVQACVHCRRYCDELRHSQAFIKSAFRSADQQSFSQEILADVRRSVMSQINTVQQSLGWAVRLERFFVSGLRTHRYAIVGFAVIAIVSASLAQIRHSAGRADNAAAMFVGRDTLICPSSYREWVFVGCSFGKTDSLNHSAETYHNVYIDPLGYREYSRSGRFPDGTVMVLEVFSAETKREPALQGSYEKDPVALQVSVKDSSRFDEGWGFYDFTESTGKLKSQAKPLPEIAGCLACHRDKAATDHVFTQFYPVLRATTAKL
jgi:cytochrome P460